MATDWVRVPISELCSAIVDCVNKTAPTVERPTPYRMIRTTNVKGGFIDVSSVRYVTEETYKIWTRRQIPRRGDIVLTREAPLGEVGLLRDDEGIFLGQRLVSYRVDPKKADNRFLLYALLSPDLQSQIQGLGAGATVAHMRVPDAERLSVLAPPLYLQQRIGSILSAYDDLIEVNRRRVAVLEEMARRLFEEWFVQFRFPCADGARRLPVGLPTGWSMVKLSDVCSAITRGIAPKYDDSSRSLVISQKCIRGQRLDLGPARRQSKPAPVEKLVRPGDVLINSTGVGTLGRVAQVEEVPGGTTVDSHVTIVRAGPSLQVDYFGMAMQRLQPVFESMGAGATGQTELNRGRVAGIEIALPQAAVQTAFGEAVRPMRILVHRLLEQNGKLSDARDLLLPRLISGELSLTAAERELEAVA